MRKLKKVVEFDVEQYTKTISELSDDDLVTTFKALKGSTSNRRLLEKKIEVIINEVNKRGAERIDDTDE